MKKIMLAFITILLSLPIMVKAYDISWFNADTYNTTTTYTITDAQQVLGLEYLVNTEGYTFEGKIIKIKPSSTTECRYWNAAHGEYNCRIDLRSYTWTPLSSSFKGTFNIADGVSGTYRIILRNGTPFIENDGKCNYDAGSYSVNLEGNCPVAMYYKRYSYTTNISEHGTVTVTPNGGGYFDKYVIIDADPANGYEVSKITIKDSEGKVIDIDWGSELSAYYVIQPDSNLNIEVTFAPKETYTIDSIPSIEHNPTDGNCELIKGDGRSIGSEVKCGSEYFYVIKNDGQTVRMLSKYNLQIGENIYKVKVNKPSDDSRPDKVYCADAAYRVYLSPRSDNFYSAEGYCFFTDINYSPDNFYQHPMAISAHWDKNDVYQYPQVGDIYITADTGYTNPDLGITTPILVQDLKIDPNSSSKYDGYFYDLTIGNRSLLETYLDLYKTNLEGLGYTVESMDLLTMEDLSNIINDNNKTIPYKDWYNHTRTIAPPHYEFASLKDYLSDKQSFAYGTTYWIRGGYGPSDNLIGVDNLIFINTSGGVCSSGVTQGTYIGYNCQSFLKLTTTLGAGLRPVITLPADAVPIKYNIKTKTDGHGTIDVVETADGDEEITFRVDSDKGYVLGKLTIITDSGEKVEFTKGALKENSDGTITISRNKFKMPFEDVTIIASFKRESIIEIIKNPDTGDKVMFTITIMMISAALGLYFYKKKESKRII